MDRNKKPAAGGHRRAGREFDSRRHSTAPLVRTLDDITAETRGLFAALDRDEWRIGANLPEARAVLNGDREFGRWCSDKLSEYDSQTLLRYRRRFEVFGHRTGRGGQSET